MQNLFSYRQSAGLKVFGFDKPRPAASLPLSSTYITAELRIFVRCTKESLKKIRGRAVDTSSGDVNISLGRGNCSGLLKPLRFCRV
jgi:hypothetical protein